MRHHGADRACTGADRAAEPTAPRASSGGRSPRHSRCSGGRVGGANFAVARRVMRKRTAVQGEAPPGAAIGLRPLEDP